MRACPRCGASILTSATICRACAAVLDGRSLPAPPMDEDAPPPNAPPPDAPSAPRTESAAEPPSPCGGCACDHGPPPRSRGHWKCAACDELVPNSFDLCWNCGLTRQGEPTPGFAWVENVEAPPDVGPYTSIPCEENIMDGWEYKSLVIEAEGYFGLGAGAFDSAQFDHEANRLGWEGWEMVAVFDTNKGHGATRFVVATFKRRLTPERRDEILRQSAR